jgi:hypothetical protein
MFRSRPLRDRGLGRRMHGPMVRQALGLLAEGHYAEAGDLFGQLADRARDHRRPLRSAQLAVQAGQAFLEAGDGDRAVLRARQAVQQLVAGRRPGRAVRVLQRMTAALRARGFNAQADALEQEARARMAEVGLDLASVPPEPIPQPRGHLPSTCPQCGGPLRADEVDWIDPASAECPYCGSVVATSLQ